MILFHQTRRRIEARRREAKALVGPEDTKPDLALGIGEFFVKNEGVEALFLPPLEKLSSFYTWWDLPFAFGMAHTLVNGRDDNVLNLLHQRIGLSLIEMEMLNLEMSDQPKGPARVLSIAEDADRLKAWSYDLADVCPVSAVSDMLRRLASMNAREVDRYVVTFLQ